MKSLSSPNVFKKDDPNKSIQMSSPSSSSSNPAGTTSAKGQPAQRTSFDNERKSGGGGSGKVIDKLISPFASFGKATNAAISFSTSSSAASSSKEITGALTVATIDQKATHDCELLFVDTENFLQEARHTIENAKAAQANESRFRKIFNAARLQKWRAKRKGNKLYSEYEVLLQRSEACEKELKAHTDKLVSDSSSLMLQALHMKARLTSCMEYNKKEIDRIKPLMDKTKDALREFVTEKQRIHEMLVFYDEINNAKLAARETYIPWAVKFANCTNEVILSSSMLNRDFIEKRQKKLEKVSFPRKIVFYSFANEFFFLFKVIEIFQDLLQKQLPYFTTKKGNLDHCAKSLQVMENILININSYRTFMKNTDEATLANTSSRLGAGNTSDDEDESEEEEEGDHPKDNSKVVMDNPLLKKLPSVTEKQKSTSADDHEESEGDDDEEEDGLVAHDDVDPTLVKPFPPAPPALGLVKQASNSSVNSQNGTTTPPSIATPNKKDSSEQQTQQRLSPHDRAPRRRKSIEELVAEVNTQNEKGKIDDSLFAAISIPPYDHALCSDCSCVYNIANDCSMHLAAIQHHAQESTLRLQKLLELREKMRKREQVLESIDWGGSD
jgi:hypothetical protein